MEYRCQEAAGRRLKAKDGWLKVTVAFDRPDPAVGAGDAAVGRGVTIAR